MTPVRIDVRLYDDLASWWPLMSAPGDYSEEAAFYGNLLRQACQGPARTLLELGSGGGNNASYLKLLFQMTLVDASPGMLAVSRQLNPECGHVQGDMRTIRLARRFDCVFVHDAVSYMTTESDLRDAIRTAAIHCRPGGAVLFAPDHLTETFRPSTDYGGHDGDGRSLRYLSWSWDPDPNDTTCITDYAYLLRSEDGSVEAVHDRHVEGLFSRDAWLRLLTEAGLAATVVPFDHSEVEPGTYQLFVARKPEAPGFASEPGRE